MAYNRRTSKRVLCLKALAWACHNWLWPVLLLIIFSPLSPHLLYAEDATSCLYLGGRGFVATSLPPEAPHCAFLTLQRRP